MATIIINKNRLFFLAVFLFFGVCIYPSCKKCNCCGAFITVVDSLGKPVAGAQVRLDCDAGQNTDCEIDETKLTDANGHADFYICNRILMVSVNGTSYGYVEIGNDEASQKLITL